MERRGTLERRVHSTKGADSYPSSNPIEEVSSMDITGRRDESYVAMGDAYFRRLLIPLIVTLLFIFGMVAIIYAPPGTDLAFPTFSNNARGAFLTR
jgi:hypothetical protein